MFIFVLQIFVCFVFFSYLSFSFSPFLSCCFCFSGRFGSLGRFGLRARVGVNIVLFCYFVCLLLSPFPSFFYFPIIISSLVFFSLVDVNIVLDFCYFVCLVFLSSFPHFFFSPIISTRLFCSSSSFCSSSFSHHH